MRHFPTLNLKITTPRLELRLPSLADLDELGERAAEGVHDEGVMPFLVPWTDATPQERARSTVAWQLGALSRMTPENWSLPFVVVVDGEVVGTQEMAAKDFAILREVSTGSWLGRRFHGLGLGTEMRTAVLHLAFAGLNADYARTEAFEDNAASLAVTRKLGYREDGVNLVCPKGKRVVSRRFRLDRADWTPAPDVQIHNLEACLPLLGAAEVA
ncbi:GNAT family protein [Nonomuraea sp. NPDC050310]|uniref:GNAT family N-acetyltransferase n=1 Tax=unclassified Nonomuraea TaxID=2593643 RepID=UPI0033DA1C0A